MLNTPGLPRLCTTKNILSIIRRPLFELVCVLYYFVYSNQIVSITVNTPHRCVALFVYDALAFLTKYPFNVLLYFRSR